MKELDWNRFATFGCYSNLDEHEDGNELVVRFLHQMSDAIQQLEPVTNTKPEGNYIGGIAVSNVGMDHDHKLLVDELPAFDIVVRLYKYADKYSMCLQFLNPYSCGELQTYIFEPAKHVKIDLDELHIRFGNFYKYLDEEEAFNFDMLLEQAKCIVDAAGSKDFGTDEFVFQLLYMRVMLEEFEVNL